MLLLLKYTQSLSIVLLLPTLPPPCPLAFSPAVTEDKGFHLDFGFHRYMPVNGCLLSITQTRAQDREKNHRSTVIMWNLERSSSSIAKHGDEVGLRLSYQIFLLCKIANSRNISTLSSNEILSRRNNRK